VGVAISVAKIALKKGQNLLFFFSYLFPNHPFSFNTLYAGTGLPDGLFSNQKYQFG
jgi:hypothetical protein